MGNKNPKSRRQDKVVVAANSDQPEEKPCSAVLAGGEKDVQVKNDLSQCGMIPGSVMFSTTSCTLLMYRR